MSFFRNTSGKIYKLFFFISIAISVIFVLTGVYIISALSIGLFAYFLLITLTKLGKTIPIKEMLVLLFLVQMVVTPLITYHMFDGQASISIKMYVSEREYINYVFFAVLALIIGLNKIESKKKLNLYFPQNGTLGLIFVGIGIVGDLGLMMKIPGLAFVFFIIRSFKFAGTFLLLFSNYKYKGIVIAIVYTLFTLSAVRSTLFYQIIIWVLFFYIFYSFKRKMSITKNLSFFIVGFLGLFLLQVVKTQVRNFVRENEGVKNIDVFIDISQNRLGDLNTLLVSGYVEGFVGRLNTGWVVSKIMEHVPKQEKYADGKKLFSDILSSFVPRFLYPNKRTVAGEEYNKLFEKYTGKQLRAGTTVNLGMLGDMYINFGLVGGVIAMFFIGKLISLFYDFLNKKGGQYIFLIPVLFFNIIKMNELFVILNSSIKVVVVIILVIFVLKKFFNINLETK